MQGGGFWELTPVRNFCSCCFRVGFPLIRRVVGNGGMGPNSTENPYCTQWGGVRKKQEQTKSRNKLSFLLHISPKHIRICFCYSQQRQRRASRARVPYIIAPPPSPLVARLHPLAVWQPSLLLAVPVRLLRSGHGLSGHCSWGRSMRSPIIHTCIFI